MPTKLSRPERLAQKMEAARVHRAKLITAGNKHLTVALPQDLLERIDDVKAQHGFRKRDDAVSLILAEYFGLDGAQNGEPAVSA